MDAIGCLYIDDLTAGKKESSGLFCSRILQTDGIAARAFECREGASLWPNLQTALQQVRAAHGSAGIVALGTGCAAALALCEQLPVERLILLFPAQLRGAGAGKGGDDRAREVARLQRFARMNLALCVCDVLVLHAAGDACARDLFAGGLRAHSRVVELILSGEAALKFLEKRPDGLDLALSGFLKSGELPKSLAENPEMCIIYG